MTARVSLSALIGKGIPEDNAKELAKIIEAEKPESPKEPLGKGAAAWLEKGGRGKAERIEAWRIGKAA